MVSFSLRVYGLVKRIPKGKVTTYKEIARKLNSRAYRAVGNSLNKNRFKDVPCHRVVCSSGYVGGFARGIEKKINMLKKEGVIINNRKISFKKYFYRL